MTKHGEASSESSGPVSADLRARLAAVTYLILPPSLGHARRATIAHRNVSQALGPGLTDKPDQPLGPHELARLRVRVLRLALGAGYRSRVPRPSMASRTGEAGARDKALAALIPAGRAAYALRHVEDVSREATVGLLADAGVSDPETAVRVSERLGAGVPSMGAADLPSAAELHRRRRRAAGVLTAAGVVLLGGGLAIVPGSDGGDQLPAGSTGAKVSVARPADAGGTTAKAPAKRAKMREAAATSVRRTDTDSAAASRAAARAEAEQAAATRAAQAVRAARAAEAKAARREAAEAAARSAEVAQATPVTVQDTARQTAREATAPTATERRAAAAAVREAEAAAVQQARQAAANRKAAANAERVRDPSLPDGGEVGTRPADPGPTGGTSTTGSDPSFP